MNRGSFCIKAIFLQSVWKNLKTYGLGIQASYFVGYFQHCVHEYVAQSWMWQHISITIYRLCRNEGGFWGTFYCKPL